MKQLLRLLPLVLIFPATAFAQFPFTETFQNATAPSMVIAGSAKLTAATGIDPVGSGYLRLTDNNVTNVGYAYCNQSFPSTYGITASFEFAMWKSDALGYNQGDGICFFLFDGSVNSFRPGGTGGSLGYTNYYTTPGMAKGYLGVSMDGFGNFSSPTDGNKPGGPGQRRGAVVIRGPGNGIGASEYVYQTGVIASDAPYNAGFMNFTQRYPSSTSANYRKIEITMTPGSTLGATLGYKITVRILKGGATPTWVTLISNQDYPFIAPANLKFGISASTGSIVNYQEIRNLTITASNTSILLAPALLPDLITTCEGNTIIDVLSNDASMNTDGSMNKTTIDLDPVTAGRQTTYTDAGKGVYTVDANGIITFAPNSGFFGISTAQYYAEDIYGVRSLLPALVTVTMNPALAPALTLDTPAPACFPSTIAINNAAYRLSSSFGASYNYFSSLSDAVSNTGNINASAGAIATPGTYYVRASLLGCVTIRPIVVQVSQAPTAANAGADVSSCASTGGYTATLIAANPVTGTGTWSQVNGPTTLATNFLNAATTPVINLAQGVYTYRWTTASGACTSSTDDVVITVGAPANAGTPQSICNGTAANLAGNATGPATGIWTKTVGPALTINNSTQANATLSGLVPGNAYTLQWKLTNGVCVNTSTVTITSLLNTTADAGPDQVRSLPTASLAGTAPETGNTGLWSIVSTPVGANPVIATPANNATSVSAMTAAGDYIFRWQLTNGSCSTFDDMKVTVVSLLPVRLISFTGELNGNQALLKWQTATEENNDHFEVERSTDGLHFATIGIIAGHGNSTTLQSYQLNDDVTSVPAGIIYYRLRQVDINLHATLSSIVTVEKGATGFSIAVLPNPVVSNSILKVKSDQGGRATIRVVSATGQTIITQDVLLNKGVTNIQLEGLKTLGSGLFHVILARDGTVVSEKLIKL